MFPESCSFIYWGCPLSVVVVAVVCTLLVSVAEGVGVIVIAVRVVTDGASSEICFWEDI